MQLQREFDSPKQERWFLPSAVVWSIAIGPDNKEVAIPLLVILRGMFAEHSFQCPVKSFLISIMAQTSCIKCDNKFVPRSDSKALGILNNGTTSCTRILPILLDFWSGIG